MSIQAFDPLTDSMLRASYRSPRPLHEVIADSHFFFMHRERQADWLARVTAEADRRLKEDMRKQASDFANRAWMDEKIAQLNNKTTAKKAGPKKSRGNRK